MLHNHAIKGERTGRGGRGKEHEGEGGEGAERGGRGNRGEREAREAREEGKRQKWGEGGERERLAMLSIPTQCYHVSQYHCSHILLSYLLTPISGLN